jgi:hypothetical protein
MVPKRGFDVENMVSGVYYMTSKGGGNTFKMTGVAGGLPLKHYRIDIPKDYSIICEHLTNLIRRD